MGQTFFSMVIKVQLKPCSILAFLFISITVLLLISAYRYLAGKVSKELFLHSLNKVKVSCFLTGMVCIIWASLGTNQDVSYHIIGAELSFLNAVIAMLLQKMEQAE